MNGDILQDLEQFLSKYRLDFGMIRNTFHINGEKISVGGFLFTIQEFCDLIQHYKQKNIKLYNFLYSKYPEYFI